ncbi:MAG: DUF748 domain-containing protein [Candidatus Omnitrophota bacterium]|nr:DUF748 domain-containing protein [Candidatus Omnitrophota bacterium]
MKVVKIVGIVLLVLFVIAIAVVFHFRYDIFQYSAESMIKRNLPEYVHVDRIIFNLKENVLQVKNFALKNPGGFKDRYMAKIASITCKYKMQGNNILDGIEVTDIEAKDPVIYIERLPDGRLNVNEMDRLMQPATPTEPVVAVKEQKKPGPAPSVAGKSISDLIKLPNTIRIRNGRLVISDAAVSRRPFYMTFEGAHGNITLYLNQDYTDVLSAGTNGSGFVNGDSSQMVSWRISMDPQTPELTMSNRVEVRNVNVMLFKPYYDRYSPIDVRGGRVSGNFVFDFDNGNIGSMNTVKLTNLRFVEKGRGAASGFWDVSVTDIIRYLESSPGEIIFDFKIKGDMQNPRFYPGPRVKEAIQKMVVDQVSQLLSPQEEGVEGAAAAAPKSDTEKVVDIIQGLLKE